MALPRRTPQACGQGSAGGRRRQSAACKRGVRPATGQQGSNRKSRSAQPAPPAPPAHLGQDVAQRVHDADVGVQLGGPPLQHHRGDLWVFQMGGGERVRAGWVGGGQASGAMGGRSARRGEACGRLASAARACSKAPAQQSAEKRRQQVEKKAHHHGGHDAPQVHLVPPNGVHHAVDDLRRLRGSRVGQWSKGVRGGAEGAAARPGTPGHQQQRGEAHAAWVHTSAQPQRTSGVLVRSSSGSRAAKMRAMSSLQKEGVKWKDRRSR